MPRFKMSWKRFVKRASTEFVGGEVHSFCTGRPSVVGSVKSITYDRRKGELKVRCHWMGRKFDTTPWRPIERREITIGKGYYFTDHGESIWANVPMPPWIGGAATYLTKDKTVRRSQLRRPRKRHRR